MSYPHSKATLPELANYIRLIHKKHKNVKITDKSHIVVTNGAVQALSAAMFYYHRKKYVDYMYAPIPYWGRFDDLASNLHITLVNQWLMDDTKTDYQQATAVKKDSGVISLITSPNNPDGQDTSKLPATIRDACYNWSHYTDKVVKFKDEVVIFSLSKFSGHSSSRIGWAITENPEIAETMQKYIDTFTSGVSIDAQVKASRILSYMNSNNDFVFDSLAGIIKKRNFILRKLVKHTQLPIKILSRQGMFLYVECDPDLVKKLNVECTNGKYFGDNEDRHRFNIGVTEEVFVEFVSRLTQVSKDYIKT